VTDRQIRITIRTLGDFLAHPGHTLTSICPACQHSERLDVWRLVERQGATIADLRLRVRTGTALQRLVFRDHFLISTRLPPVRCRDKGRPLTQSGFRLRFFGLLKALRDTGTIGAGLSFHGLCHTAGKTLTESGCDRRTIAAVLGQATTTMVEQLLRPRQSQEPRGLR